MQVNQGVLKIDRSALRANFTLLESKSYGNTPVAAAVKADAYGLGIQGVAPVLAESGCKTFFVATLEEGIGLRAILPKAEIYVLSGVLKGTGALYKAHNLKPVLNSPEDIARLSEEKSAGPCAVHFDTGMNRLGLGSADTEKFLSGGTYKNIQVDLVMSHFACADEKDHPLTNAQYESFKKIASHFPGAKKSIANSSGIFRGSKYHFDLLRPGMALYGLNPTPETANPMQSVVSLEACILQVRQALKGESVGYAAGHVLDKNSTLATVSIGYADGFLRALSGRGKLYWKGVPCPILGRVSMDLTVIDISHIPDAQKPSAGDLVEVLGPHQSADDLAADAGTIGYEILTGLGARYSRTYI